MGKITPIHSSAGFPGNPRPGCGNRRLRLGPGLIRELRSRFEEFQEGLAQPGYRSGLALDFLLGDIKITHRLQEALLKAVVILSEEINSEGLKFQLGLSRGHHLLLAHPNRLGQALHKQPSLGLNLAGTALLRDELILGKAESCLELPNLDRLGRPTAILGFQPSPGQQARRDNRKGGGVLSEEGAEMVHISGKRAKGGPD